MEEEFPLRGQVSCLTFVFTLVDPPFALTACHDAAIMDDEQQQFVHAKLPVHSQYDRDRL